MPLSDSCPAPHGCMRLEDPRARTLQNIKILQEQYPCLGAFMNPWGGEITAVVILLPQESMQPPGQKDHCCSNPFAPRVSHKPGVGRSPEQ